MESTEERIVELISCFSYSEALDAIDSVPLEPRSASSVYPYRGYVLYLQRRYRDSRDFLRHLVERYPPNIKARRFLYMTLMEMDDLSLAFSTMRECWELGDYRRSTLIYMLSHMLMFKEFDMLDSLCEHSDEVLLVCVGHIYGGRPDRAVELMKAMDDSEEKIHLHALLSVYTRSVYILDYVSCLDEDILVRAIEKSDKQKVFGGVEKKGCEYMDGKVLRIARSVLGDCEYDWFVRRFNSQQGPVHSCNMSCEVGRLQVEDREMSGGRDCADGLLGRYSDMERVVGYLRDRECGRAIDDLKTMYRIDTTLGLQEYLRTKQNTFVLNRISKCYNDCGNSEESARYARLSASAYSSCVRDKIECLVRLLDENRVGDIISLLELRLFGRDYFDIVDPQLQKDNTEGLNCLRLLSRGEGYFL